MYFGCTFRLSKELYLSNINIQLQQNINFQLQQNVNIQP